MAFLKENFTFLSTPIYNLGINGKEGSRYKRTTPPELSPLVSEI
jgi:hypothetical protein